MSFSRRKYQRKTTTVHARNNANLCLYSYVYPYNSFRSTIRVTYSETTFYFMQGVLEATEFLLKSNHKPQRTFYIAFGHDEEVNFSSRFDYLLFAIFWSFFFLHNNSFQNISRLQALMVLRKSANFCTAGAYVILSSSLMKEQPLSTISFQEFTFP